MTRTTAPTGALTPKQKTPDIKIVVSHDQIAQMAYAIWERRGRPQGHCVQHWLAAEAELKKTATASPQVAVKRG